LRVGNRNAERLARVQEYATLRDRETGQTVTVRIARVQ
jgi:hypothetical protein